MGFVLALVFFILLAVILHFLGKTRSILICGAIFLGFVIYFSYFGEHNTKFYCDKTMDQCLVMTNTRFNKEFKEKRTFKISDIDEVKYEEKMETYLRKGIRKSHLHREIFFVMKDGSKKMYPSSLLSTKTDTNNQILNDIKRFLNGYDKEYVATTNKKNAPSYGWWIFAFLFGSFVGIKLYGAFVEEGQHNIAGKNMSDEEKILLNVLKNFQKKSPKQYPLNFIDTLRKADLKDSQIELLIHSYLRRKCISPKEHDEIINFLKIKKCSNKKASDQKD